MLLYISIFQRIGFIIFPFVFLSCESLDTNVQVEGDKVVQKKDSLLFHSIPTEIDSTKFTIETRFKVPEGYRRVGIDTSSFGAYLRNLPLKPIEAPVLYYDGTEKPNKNVYVSVIDLPIGNRDLHQCADALMRFRAEYLRSQKRFDEIHFNFNNGFTANYSKWKEGYRIKFDGADFKWVKKEAPSNSDDTFWKYMEYVFAFAGTYSLAQELESISLNDMKIGDLFIFGGSPGHAVMVVDMAVHKETGEKIFMLIQSYMPAQETQVLINPNDLNLTPWYSSDFKGELLTPEWRFEGQDLKRF